MSLEKAIQKLTQVIQAQTPPGPSRGVPDGSPIGREVKPKNPCTIEYPKGHPAYCFCYKRANRDFAGNCYFKSGNKCYRLDYSEGVDPRRTQIICANGGSDCCPIGIKGEPADVSPIS